MPLHSGTNLQNRSAAYLNSGNSRDFDACLPSFHLQSLHTFATAHNCRCKQFQEGPNARLTSCSTCANRGCSRCCGDFCKIPRVPRITLPSSLPSFFLRFDQLIVKFIENYDRTLKEMRSSNLLLRIRWLDKK